MVRLRRVAPRYMLPRIHSQGCWQVVGQADLYLLRDSLRRCWLVYGCRPEATQLLERLELHCQRFPTRAAARQALEAALRLERERRAG